MSSKFVVSFAGVIGFAQGLEVVIGAAENLRSNNDIVFVLVGDGVKKPELESAASSKKLKNVIFVPTMPVATYPQILHASDVCLVTLRQDLVTPVVPGKMLSIMAAGKPILASLPLAGDAPKIISKFECGVAVRPSDPRALADAIIRLYNNKSLLQQMGKNGRDAAIKYFSREACVDQYISLFNRLVRND